MHHHHRSEPTTGSAGSTGSTGLTEVQERRRRALAYRDRLEALRVRGESDGAVVVLGHTGAVLDLRLDGALADGPAGRARSALLAANRLAQQRLGARVGDLTAEAFGADSATTREVVRHYAATFQHVEAVSPDAAGAAGVLR